MTQHDFEPDFLYRVIRGDLVAFTELQVSNPLIDDSYVRDLPEPFGSGEARTSRPPRGPNGADACHLDGV
jgi:hypothetical protein